VLEPDARLSYAIHALKTLEPDDVVEVTGNTLVVVEAGTETSY